MHANHILDPIQVLDPCLNTPELLILSTRCSLQILITTHTNEDMSHFARVGIFNSGLRMTYVGRWRLTLTWCNLISALVWTLLFQNANRAALDGLEVWIASSVPIATVTPNRGGVVFKLFDWWKWLIFRKNLFFWPWKRGKALLLLTSNLYWAFELLRRNKTRGGLARCNQQL